MDVAMVAKDELRARGCALVEWGWRIDHLRPAVGKDRKIIAWRPVFLTGDGLKVAYAIKIDPSKYTPANPLTLFLGWRWQDRRDASLIQSMLNDGRAREARAPAIEKRNPHA